MARMMALRTSPVSYTHLPRFWELLDSMTGGRARALRAELRRFNTCLLYTSWIEL